MPILNVCMCFLGVLCSYWYISVPGCTTGRKGICGETHVLKALFQNHRYDRDYKYNYKEQKIKNLKLLKDTFSGNGNAKMNFGFLSLLRFFPAN